MGATLFTVESYWAYGLPVNHYYLLLVFSGTLLIYSLHRIIGISKLSLVQNSGRFKVIRQYKSHIQFYIFLSFLLLNWAMWKLGTDTLWRLSGAGLISMAYVVPFFGGGRRLRDFNYIKIILISAVWAYVSVLPLIGEIKFTFLALTALERFVFIFAITLPFDLRDLSIDSSTQLITIPKIIGQKSTYWLCTILMVTGLISLFFVVRNSIQAYYLSSHIMIHLSYLITFTVMMIAKDKQSDLYYSGLLDSTLVIRGLVMWVFLLVI